MDFVTTSDDIEEIFGRSLQTTHDVVLGAFDTVNSCLVAGTSKTNENKILFDSAAAVLVSSQKFNYDSNKYRSMRNSDLVNQLSSTNSALENALSEYSEFAENQTTSISFTMRNMLAFCGPMLPPLVLGLYQGMKDKEEPVFIEPTIEIEGLEIVEIIGSNWFS